MFSWWPVIAIAAVFAAGGVVALLIDRYGKKAQALGRAEGDRDASIQRNRENADVMQKQDELAAIAAQRADSATTAERLRNGTF